MRNVKLWDWVVWNQRFKWKIIEYFMSLKKIIFFLCMYKMVDISAETWNKAEVVVINIHENNNVNKTLFKLLCISDVKKDGVVKIFMTWLIKKLKENMRLKIWMILQSNKLESIK